MQWKKKEKQYYIWNIIYIYIDIASPYNFFVFFFRVDSFNRWESSNFSNVSLYTVEIEGNCVVKCNFYSILKSFLSRPTTTPHQILSSSYMWTAIIFLHFTHTFFVSSLKKWGRKKKNECNSALLSSYKSLPNKKKMTKKNVLNVIPSATCMFLFTHDLYYIYHQSFFISYKMASKK